ncbi:hypothetical protein SLS62_001211 [Diatrype stigma]|uniref:Uncharacterized protein n=1 Tax=Diatrype stigma TaxID=117547 RepID=A0AAN9YRZ9_9PEZI
MDDLQSLPDVLHVWPNTMVYLNPEEASVTDDFPTPQNYTSHNATGVSKLHESGIFGKGVKVGIVDTGTWYEHEALGGGFGEGFKVAAGYDFVGDGPNKEYQAGTDSATIIEAFLKAYEDGVDIITSSIGGAGGWSDDAWAEVASRIAEEGVIVTIAAGNDGAYGPAYHSNGAAGQSVLSIASIEGDLFPAFSFGANITENGVTNTTVLGYVPANDYFPPSVVGWPIVALSFNTSNDREACDPYPEGTRNLTGVIPLVRRGWCSYTIKVNNLEALGAEYILFYNNEDPLSAPGYPFAEPVVGLVTAEVGEAIIDVLKTNGSVTADFSVDPEDPISYKDSHGGEPNYFTSWGPLYDLTIKPDVAAPGGNIYSAWLDNSYAVLSGTSMACPYVAGVAALYISVHGGRDVHGKGFAKSFNSRVVSSGMSLPWAVTDDEGFVASVAQVGGGLVNGFKVVNYTTTIDFEKFSLNDTAHFSGSHDIAITNSGSEEVSYDFALEAAAGIEAVGWLQEEGGDTIRVKELNELTPVDLSISATLPETFSLQPGQSKTVSYTFDLSLSVQDFPKIYVKTVWGSKQIRWDVYEAGWNESMWSYPPVEGQNGYLGAVAGWAGAESSAYFDPDQGNPNQTITYPRTDTVRSKNGGYTSHWWFGKLGNGSQIELGTYRWRFATLKPFGDPVVSEDWEIYDTPEIQVLGKYE